MKLVRAVGLSLGAAGLSASLLWAVSGAQTASPPFSPDFSNFMPLCRGDLSTPGIALGDVNGDGRLDIVFGNGRHLPQPNLLYVNGNRRDLFFPPRPFGNSATYAVVLADIDRDGDLDLVEGNDYGFWNEVWLNDGHGNFSSEYYFGRDDQTRAIAVGDLTGDGFPDIVAANQGPGESKVYINDGVGRFRNARPLPIGDAQAVGVARGDFNGDGHLDIVLSTLGKHPNYLLLNDGQGGFPTAVPFGSAGGTRGAAIGVGDMNSDGHLDVVVGNRSQAGRIFFGDGKGAFPESISFGPETGVTYSIAVGDIDGDGILDVVVGYDTLDEFSVRADGAPASPDSGGPVQLLRRARKEASRVYLNDGRARLREGPTFGASGTTIRAVALGDVDGDGRLDIVVGNDCANNAIYLNRNLPLVRR